MPHFPCRIFCASWKYSEYWPECLLHESLVIAYKTICTQSFLSIYTVHFSRSLLFLFGAFSARVTVEMPLTNFVVKSTLALENIPSFNETMMNWALRKLFLITRPMFWVWDMSRAASTSSRMYNGAGLYCNSANTNERPAKERWPPLSSSSVSFHKAPNCTLISKPVRTRSFGARSAS